MDLGEDIFHTLKPKNRPMQIGTDTAWVNITPSSHSAFAVKSDSSLWAWGFDIYVDNGGSNFEKKRSSLTQIEKGSKWKSIVSEEGFSFGIKSDNTLWAWAVNGEGNARGQLGDGTTDTHYVPAPISPGSKWIDIIPSYGYCFGIKADGTLWAWGNNDYGQLGDGTVTQRNSPVQIK